jgi:hypothetical protein
VKSSSLYDVVMSLFAFIIYYIIVCSCAVAGVILWVPIFMVAKVYSWSKRRAPLEQK